MDLQQHHQIDRYEVEAVLGRGGMATVYLVRHMDLDARHALKVLHMPVAAVQQRLLLEGRVQSQLSHQNLVAVTDMVRVDGSPGLVMEWIAGPALDRWLQHTRLSWPQADALARGILAGVAEAHRHGLIHRDLKPSNVLLAVEGDAVIPKVTDFGLAKLLTSEDAPAGATRSGIAMGSPAYMSPEQIRDARRVDERADVFALGAVLYELVTGIRAFAGGGDALEIFDHIRRGEFRDPRPMVPDLPESCAAVIERCLSVEREDRPRSASELLSAWTAGRSAPENPWSDDDRADMADLAPEPRALSASLSGSTGSETFSEFDLSLGPGLEPLRPLSEAEAQAQTWAESTREAVPVAPPSTRRPRWAAALAVVLAAASVGWWLLSDPVAVLGSEVPQIADGPTQQALERGWAEILDGDLEEASETLNAADSSIPLLLLAEGAALRMVGRRSAGNRALWEAAAEEQTGEPGFELATAVVELHAKRGADPIARFTAYRDAHPEDVLASILYLDMAAPTLGPPREQALADVRAEVGDTALPAILEAREPMRLGRAERAAAVARAGLEQHPDHPALLLALGQAEADLGALEDARRSLAHSLELRQTANGYTALASTTLLLGDEVAADEVIERALHPSVPPAERISFAVTTAHVLGGLGRVAEAVAMLAEAQDLAEQTGDMTPIAMIIGTEAVIYMNVNLTTEMQDATDRLHAMLLLPEFPDEERNVLVRNLTYAQAISAVRNGNLERAKTLSAQLERAGIGPVYREWLRREIAASEGRLEDALGDFASSPPGCERTLLMAQVADQAGNLPRAADFAAEGLAGDCQTTGEMRLLLAQSWVILADQAHREGRIEDAQMAIARYSELWPRPDASLPLAQRAQAILAQR